MATARMMAIAAGYEDADDLDALRHDPALMIACSRLQANQFRLFLHMGAYWLLHALGMAAPKRSRWRGATSATIRCVFVKIAVRVEESRRQIELAFPRHLPHAYALALITARLTAQGPRPARQPPPSPS